jgi:hypothetical protein
VIHLPGINNILPDALSRLFPPEKELVGSTVGDDEKLHSSVFASVSTNKIVRAASLTYLKENMMEPPTDEEKKNILEKAHLFGHFGAEAIVKAIHNNGIHWKNMKEEAIQLIKTCSQCQKFNIVKTGYNPHRPVHSLLPFDHIAIDMAGPLPITERKNKYLLVMIDICTRFVILRPLQDKTAESVVQAILPVFCDFGIPRVLQSDNGKEFANQVMERFKMKAGFDHRLITAYHPQANGAAEKSVGTAMTVIKKAVKGVDHQWDLYVPAIQLAINNKPSKRLNTPPFNIMFGRRMNDFAKYNEETGEKTPLTQEEVNQRLDDLKNIIFPAIQEKTAITIKQQKSKFDKKNMQKDFPVDSYVRVKIPAKLRSKMDVIYEGPYQVIRKTQAGTYVLKDLEGDKLHRNYTVEELKEVDIPNHTKENTYEVERIVAHEKDPVTQKYKYKVKWLNFADSHNTWEPEDNFYAQEVITRYWKQLLGQDYTAPKKNNNQSNKRKNQENDNRAQRKYKQRKNVHRNTRK